MTLFQSVRSLLKAAFAAAVLVTTFTSQAADAQPKLQASPNDLVFVVEFNIKPEAREAFLASLNHVVENMAKEDTFVLTYLHQDVNDANKFLIYERWAEPSMDAFMENQLRGKRYRDDYENRLPGWSSEPRKITVLSHLGAWKGQ